MDTEKTCSEKETKHLLNQFIKYRRWIWLPFGFLDNILIKDAKIEECRKVCTRRWRKNENSSFQSLSPSAYRSLRRDVDNLKGSIPQKFDEKKIIVQYLLPDSSREVICTKCGGRGRVLVQTKCPRCGGTGVEERTVTRYASYSDEDDEEYTEESTCIKCDGEGVAERWQECLHCEGTGHIYEAKVLSLEYTFEKSNVWSTESVPAKYLFGEPSIILSKREVPCSLNNDDFTICTSPIVKEEKEVSKVMVYVVKYILGGREYALYRINKKIKFDNYPKSLAKFLLFLTSLVAIISIIIIAIYYSTT